MLTVLNVAYPLAPVSPRTAGGAEQVLLQLDRALVERGHRSLVVACEGSQVAGELIPTPRPPSLLDEGAKRDAQAHHARTIAKALREHPIDVVHLHGLDFEAYLPPSGPPVLVTLHLPLGWYSPDALRLTRPNTYLHCVSEAHHRTAPSDLHLLPPIENGVEVNCGRLPRKRNFALYLGRLCPEKGVHLAIEAAARANLPLLIAGETYGYPEHIRYFESRIAPHLGPRCRFLGPIGPRVKRKLLAMAHCVLLPSLAQETSSLVAREALAAGTPTIAFPNGAMAEVIAHGRTGFLVRDVEQMAGAISDADTIDPEECRAEARERFPLAKMLDAYFDVYRSLARAATRGSRMPLATHVLDTLEAAAALLPEWRALWLTSETTTPFQSPDWQLAWWNAFSPGELRIVTVREDGKLVGLAPLYREDAEYGPRLLPLGISLSDFVDVLIDSASAEATCEAIAAAVTDSADIDSAEWGELPPAANLLRMAAPRGWEMFVEAGTACPVAKLPEEPALLPNILSPSRRRHLKTARNRAARRGAIEIVLANENNAPALLSELIRLHTAAWRERGEPGVFSDPRVGEFHAAALPRLMQHGIVRLYALTVGGTLAAAYYGFQHRRHAYAYLSGYDPVFAFESPGALLLAHTMEQAIREGAEEFHFLRGRESYKYEWGGRDRRNLRLTLARKTQRRAYG